MKGPSERHFEASFNVRESHSADGTSQDGNCHGDLLLMERGPDLALHGAVLFFFSPFQFHTANQACERGKVGHRDRAVSRGKYITFLAS
jgi:hypothetical protein